MAWATIGKTCFESNDQMSDNDFMESATSALRAITQKLQDSNAGGFLQVRDPSIELVTIRSTLVFTLNISDECRNPIFFVCLKWLFRQTFRHSKWLIYIWFDISGEGLSL